MVRSRGYFATVKPAGRSFRVVSHSYQSRTTAEFWLKVFKDIGLRANIMPLQESAVQLTQVLEVESLLNPPQG